METYRSLLEEAQALETSARALREKAELVHKEERKKDISKWVGYHFESSSSLTPEFAEFSLQVTKELKKIKGYELAAYSRGHFEFSAFLKNKATGNFAYVSCSDVRFFSDQWWTNLLIREARNEKDYRGGRNFECKFTEIKKIADQLTK